VRAAADALPLAPTTDLTLADDAAFARALDALDASARVAFYVRGERLVYVEHSERAYLVECAPPHRVVGLPSSARRWPRSADAAPSAAAAAAAWRCTLARYTTGEERYVLLADVGAPVVGERCVLIDEVLGALVEPYTTCRCAQFIAAALVPDVLDAMPVLGMTVHQTRADDGSDGARYVLETHGEQTERARALVRALATA